MSKLKRRKTAAEEIKSEQQFSSDENNGAARHRNEDSAGEGSSCWTSSALSDVENLWMKTVQTLCPQASSQDTMLCVPHLPHLHLPHLSTKVEIRSDQRWCSLGEDVLPLPDVLPQTRSGGHALSALSDMCECEQDMNKTAAAVVEVKETKSRTSLRSEIKSGSVTEQGEEAGTPGPGLRSDTVRLEHCPMCLMSFPAGFSQLECDGHLAQCLSEMNVDVVW